MGYQYFAASTFIPLTEASSTNSRKIKVTSVVCSPAVENAVSAYATLYAATAATANTEVMHLRCGTAGRTVSWSDPTGMALSKLYVLVNCSIVTLVWD